MWAERKKKRKLVAKLVPTVIAFVALTLFVVIKATDKSTDEDRFIRSVRAVADRHRMSSSGLTNYPTLGPEHHQETFSANFEGTSALQDDILELCKDWTVVKDERKPIRWMSGEREGRNTVFEPPWSDGTISTFHLIVGDGSRVTVSMLHHSTPKELIKRPSTWEGIIQWWNGLTE